MPKLSAQYRVKALAAEECAKTAPNPETKVAWTEIAIEWHALATKTAVGFADDIQIGWTGPPQLAAISFQARKTRRGWDNQLQLRLVAKPFGNLVFIVNLAAISA
jgi:hypothetical protein